MPTNTSNGFKQSEFLVNKIFDSTPWSNCVICKNKIQLSLEYGKWF